MIEKLIDAPVRVIAGLTALLVLASVLGVTVLAEGTVQQPVPKAAPTDQFSVERAMVHLERIADEPRPLGSPASDRTRDYLAEHLRAAGLDVQVQQAVGARTAAGLATFGRVDDVVATLPGRESTGTVVLAAHYDSAAVGPGAADDGAAAAAILETVRAVRAHGPLRNDLVLLLTDGEEDGLLGAEAFVREHPLARRGGVVLNWEARGSGGPSLMFETSRNNGRLVELFTDAVPHPRGSSSMVEMYRVLPNNSDFTALSKAGFIGLNSANIEDASYYHTAGDSIANLDRGTVQHQGETMLSLTRTLGDADLPTLRADHDRTYFSLFGAMISYPDTMVLPLAVLAVLLVVALVAVARLRQLVSISRVLLGAASAVLPLVGSVLLGQALWQLLVSLRPGYDAMGGLLHRPAPYQAAVVVLVALSLLGWYLPLRRRVGPAALAIGALIWPAGLAVLCAVAAPGASYLFALPASGAALAGLVAVGSARSRVLPVVVLPLGAILGMTLLSSLARDAFTGVGLALAGGPALVIALLGLILLPIAELFCPNLDRRLDRRVAVTVPALAAGLAVALVGTGLAVDRADGRHPERSHLAYVLNADTGTATWVSGDDKPTDWVNRFVNSRDTTALPPGYLRGRLWTGPAQPIGLAGPELALLSRKGDTVTFRVTSKRSARNLTLRVEQPIVAATAAVSGSTPVTVLVSGTRANTWPGEVRFRDLPADGVNLTLRVPGADRVRVTVIDETHDLADAPGFAPRPSAVVASVREDGDLVAVARTYEL